MNNLFGLILLLFSFFASNYASAEVPGASKTTGGKIQLGVIVPLSGPLAFFGNDYVRAYDLLKADFPDIENFIDIHWEDSAYDSKQALSAFNKLVAVNHADIIFSFGGPMLNALAPVAESKKIPFFATESEKRDCEGRVYCSLFRNEEDEWGEATWRILRKQGRKNIGIVKNQNQFMNTFVNAIVRTKKDDETTEILLDVPPDMTDLRSSVLSLKSKNIDALGVYLLPASHHGFLDALKSLPKAFPLFGVEEFLVEENNKGFENLIEGTLVIAPHATRAYRAKFEAKYGHSAGFYYTPAFYDFMTLLKDIVAANPNLRGVELVNALHFQGKREGVSGEYSVKLSKDGVYSYSFPIAVYKVSRKGISVVVIILFSSLTASAESSKAFEVGLVLPLTGNAADYGVAIKNSIDLAIKDKPELFTNVKFHYEDATYDPKTAVTALHKLIDGRNVNLSVTWGVSFCKALAPIAESRKTHLVGICLDPTIAANKHYVLRFKNTTDEIMRAQSQYLYNHGIKRIGLLLAEHPYLEESAQALERDLIDGQTLTIIDQIPNNHMDLRTNILKIKRNIDNFDSIGIFLFAGQIATFYRQMRELNFNIPTFGTDFFESLSEIRASNGAMNGVIFTSIEVKEDFLKKYRAAFHNESQLAFGAPAYEFATIVGELFNNRGNNITADEVIESFSTVTSRDGVASGPYKYVNDAKVGQYFQFPVVVKKIVNGTFEVVR